MEEIQLWNWEKHPRLGVFFTAIKRGQWVTHAFEWLFMMVSRITGYLMTLAIGYLILYAIEYKHSLDAVIAHPGFADSLASFSNVLINVGPELVFPGTVTLCIQAFQARHKLDGWLYLITTIGFVILTMVLLNAYMSGQITADFLSAMLFWRAFAALWYTAIAAYCAGHGEINLRALVKELDALRTSIQQESSAKAILQTRLKNEQEAATELRKKIQETTREITELREQAQTLQQQLRDQGAAHTQHNNVIARLQSEHQQALAAQSQTHREERARLEIKLQELQRKLTEQPIREKIKEVPRANPVQEKAVEEENEEEECIEGLFEYGKSVYEWNGQTYYTKAEAATRWGLTPRQVETFTASHPHYALILKERGDLKPRARLIQANALEKAKQAS